MSDNEANFSFDETYGKNREMFGHPYKELQDYFRAQPKGSVLDIGSGQGRDALFLASLGYNVTAVDISKVGIQQMLEQNPNITGIVADILKFETNNTYDMVLFDMVLHGFDQEQRELLLKRFAKNTNCICIVAPDKEDAQKLSQILNENWKVTDEMTVKDTPKLPGETEEYVFEMVILKQSELS